ncbi:MEKHLA domain-containing protein [Paenibacillus turpanensis]|uniref:MEKHLA domain-containing protein n=1 Tax=Paenibacillus turpanensis TaxID=2689078 RepID=UPI001FB64D68|nr:MEKHLA domain-containing protein [Paenibacillus turpanensis]
MARKRDGGKMEHWQKAIRASSSSTRTNEEHARLLVESYEKLLGRPLLEPGNGTLAERLFHSKMVVLSHGTEADPILNYGNAAALKLWEMDWDRFTSTPSRYTAEALIRADRERFMAAVSEQGYADHYTGVRISATGRRFTIQRAAVWNVTDELGNAIGQAAAFPEYTYLP